MNRFVIEENKDQIVEQVPEEVKAAQVADGETNIL